MRFRGTVALVTGGGSGIGRRTAERLAAEGAAVSVLDRDGGAARRVADGIAGGGGLAAAAVADVREPDQVDAAVAETLGRFGAVDVLVNNAAVAEADGLASIDDDAWERELDVALSGSFRCTRAVLPSMLARGSGAIVNVGSVNGLAMYGQEAYSAAKAGVESLTRSIAVRYGPAGIRANTVAPGTVATPAWDARVEANPAVFDELAAWYPLGRVGTPDDVASAVLFLASAEASWITGTTLVVDGGLLAGGYRMISTAVGEGRTP